MKWQAWPMRGQKKRTRPSFTPKATLDELAAEFGISKGMLQVLLMRRSGPKPVLTRENGVQQNYYDPREMRAWWNSLIKRSNPDENHQP